MSKFFCFHCADSNYFSILFRFHRIAIQQSIYRRSFKVAFVVGTLLNLINQPQAVLGVVSLDYPAMQRIDVVKALLSYTVPFMVASYGALTAIAHQRTDS